MRRGGCLEHTIPSARMRKSALCNPEGSLGPPWRFDPRAAPGARSGSLRRKNPWRGRRAGSLRRRGSRLCESGAREACGAKIHGLCRSTHLDPRAALRCRVVEEEHRESKIRLDQALRKVAVKPHAKAQRVRGQHAGPEFCPSLRPEGRIQHGCSITYGPSSGGSPPARIRKLSRALVNARLRHPRG